MKLALLSRLTAAPTTRARSLGFLAWLFWLDVKASLQLASGGGVAWRRIDGSWTSPATNIFLSDASEAIFLRRFN